MHSSDSNEDFQRFFQQGPDSSDEELQAELAELGSSSGQKAAQKKPEAWDPWDVMTSLRVFQHFESLNFRVFQKVPLDLRIRLLCG